MKKNEELVGRLLEDLLTYVWDAKHLWRHELDNKIREVAAALTEAGAGEATPRLHCNHCPALFSTEWERAEHEREGHAIQPAGQPPC